MELTADFIINNRLNSKWSKDVPGWKLISSDLTDYDEGLVTTEYIFYNEVDDEYWHWFEYSNSWDDYYEEAHEEPTRVYPREVTVIQYFNEPN